MHAIRVREKETKHTSGEKKDWIQSDGEANTVRLFEGVTVEGIGIRGVKRDTRQKKGGIW